MHVACFVVQMTVKLCKATWRDTQVPTASLIQLGWCSSPNNYLINFLVLVNVILLLKYLCCPLTQTRVKSVNMWCSKDSLKTLSVGISLNIWCIISVMGHQFSSNLIICTLLHILAWVSCLLEDSQTKECV